MQNRTSQEARVVISITSVMKAPMTSMVHDIKSSILEGLHQLSDNKVAKPVTTHEAPSFWRPWKHRKCSARNDVNLRTPRVQFFIFYIRIGTNTQSL